jgi:hypothetical protein
MPGEQAHRFELFERDQPGTQTIIYVVVVVGYFIGQIAYLRFQRRTFILEKATSDFTELPSRRRGAMLEDARARLEHQIQTIESSVALLQLVDDAQGLEVMLESVMFYHAFVECILTGMTEGRMSKIVGKSDRFGQVIIDFQCTGNRTGNLCNLNRVRQACPEQIAFVIDEYLRLVFQSPKCSGMYDAIAITLKLAARLGSWLYVLSASCCRLTDRVIGELSHNMRL